MTEGYARLGRKHTTKTNSTARLIWTLMKKPEEVQWNKKDVA